EGDLRVVMGVRIDDAGRDDQPGGVDLLFGGRVDEMSDAGDPAVADADIDSPARQAGAVDHHAVADDQVIIRPRPPRLHPCRLRAYSSGSASARSPPLAFCSAFIGTVRVSRPERSTLPGSLPVCSPFRTICTPLTKTWSTPVASA